MTTLTERIEAAAREIDPRIHHPRFPISDAEKEERWARAKRNAERVLRAAFPEIVPAPGEQPRCWLAPWMPTEAMTEAALEGGWFDNGVFHPYKALFDGAWIDARDAHLKEQD